TRIKITFHHRGTETQRKPCDVIANSPQAREGSHESVARQCSSRSERTRTPKKSRPQTNCRSLGSRHPSQAKDVASLGMTRHRWHFSATANRHRLILLSRFLRVSVRVVKTTSPG